MPMPHLGQWPSFYYFAVSCIMLCTSDCVLYCERCVVELEESIDKLVLLAPDTKKRKAFVTAFKWVVAFASWRYVRTPQEEAAQQAQQKILGTLSVLSNYSFLLFFTILLYSGNFELSNFCVSAGVSCY